MVQKETNLIESMMVDIMNNYKKTIVAICSSLVVLVFFKFYLLDKVIFKNEVKLIDSFYSDGENYVKAIRNNDQKLIDNFAEISKVPINYIDKNNNRNLLLWAVAYKNYSLAEKLIKQGIDVRFEDPKSGFTALHFAVIDQNLNLVTILVENGAIIESKSKDLKISPLDLAIKSDNKAIINYFESKKK